MKEAIRLYTAGKYRQAVSLLLSLEPEESELPEYSYYLGLCYTQLGKFDEALLYLEQVVTSVLDFVRIFQSRLVIGYIYAATRRFRLAEIELTGLLEEGYESAKVHAALGFVHFAQRDYLRSREALHKALELDPENRNAMNSIGYVLAESGGNLDEALAFCRKAVSGNPKRAAYLDSLGWVYFRRGEYAEAVRYLRKALDASPGNREILAHLEAVKNA